MLSLLKGISDPPVEEITPSSGLFLCFMCTSTVHESPSVIILLFNGVFLYLTVNTLRVETVDPCAVCLTQNKCFMN